MPWGFADMCSFGSEIKTLSPGSLARDGVRFGDWALYVKGRVPAYNYNFLGLQRTSIAGTGKLPQGKATLQFVLDYEGGGAGKGGQGAALVNGQKVAGGCIEHTKAGIFSADTTADMGIDLGTPVVEAIGAEAKPRFTGRIPKLAVLQVNQSLS